MAKKTEKKSKPAPKEEEIPAESNDLEDEIMADLAELDSAPAPTPSAEPEPEVANETPEESGEHDDFADDIDDLPDDMDEDLAEEEQAPEATEPSAEPAAVPESSPEAEPSAPETKVDVEDDSAFDLVEEGTEDGEELAEAEETEMKASMKLDERTQKRNIVEAALFVAGRPISLEELNIKTEFKKKDLEDILKDLMMEYMERPSSIEIIQIGDKFSLQIKPEYTQDVKKFASGGLIPEAVLKTLTIIALKQPMMKSMLIKVRGAGAYDHIKFLADRGFIEQSKKGRSQELITTDLFADTFGLSRNPSMLKKQLIAQLGIKGDEGPAPEGE
jgi:segregation and condensation protein B